MNSLRTERPEDYTQARRDTFGRFKPVTRAPLSFSDRFMRWSYGIAAFGIASVGLDVYVHEGQRQAYCSKLQKDFEASYSTDTGASIYVDPRGNKFGKVLDVPSAEVRYLVPFHKESCFVGIPYKTYQAGIKP